METSTAAKVLSGGTAGAGVLGASGYGIHTLSTNSNKPETIEDQLKLEGEDILPTDNKSEDSVWKELVDENKKLPDNHRDKLTWEGNDRKDIEKMKRSCSYFLGTKLTDDNTGMLNQARGWCVKRKS